MKHLLRALALTLALAVGVNAQVTVPNTLQAGATIRSSELNTNFDELGTKALNRISGGQLEGNVIILADVTLDGVDISDYLDPSGYVFANTAGAVTTPSFALVSDTNTGLYFPAADEIALSLGGTQRLLLNASGLTVFGVNIVNSSGKIPALSSTYFASLDGSALTNIVAASATTATNFSGNLTGDVGGTQGATTITPGVIVNADINAAAAIVDTKLDTIATAGKVSNSATTATSANTASAIVARDGSGNFTAGTLTLTGLTIATGAQDGYVWTSDINGVGAWEAVPTGTLGGSGTDGTIGKFSGGATTLGDSLLTESGSTISLTSSQDAVTSFTVRNLNATSGAIARIAMQVQGATSGDPYLGFFVNAVQDWALGVDVSDSSAFVLSATSTLGTSNALHITPAGLVTLSTIKITGGSPGAGKVLTSDADGDASWTTLSSDGVPTGAIIMMAGACPSGYARFTALDSSFPRGASSYGATGGSSSHDHSFSDTSTTAGSHSHTFADTSSSDGAHTHTITSASVQSGSGGGGLGSSTSSSNGSHTHDVSGSTSSVAAHSHDVSGTTGNTGNLPPYLNMVFCQKS